MSKYICVDYLEPDTEWDEYHDGFTAYSQMAIDTAPSIEIIRCEECKYGQDDLFHMFCGYHHHKTYADDFCSYGERKGE